MSLWGESYSKFKASDATVVELNYSVIRPNWNTPKTIRNTSILSGTTTFSQLADDFSSFEVIVHLHKEVDAATKFNEIIAYNHDTVNFMPHEDSGNYVQGSGGDAEFFIAEMQPYYINDDPPIAKTMLKIVFVSLEPTYPETST